MRTTESLRDRLYRYQQGRCWICCEELGDDVTIDHVIPLSRGGRNKPGNKLLAHMQCNREKGCALPAFRASYLRVAALLRLRDAQQLPIVAYVVALWDGGNVEGFINSHQDIWASR